MNNIPKTIYKISHAAMTVLACFFTVSVFILNFIYNSEVSYDSSEITTISYNVFFGLISVGLFILLILGVIFLYKCAEINRINEKVLFFILTAVYSVFALYLILNVDNTIRADAYTTFSIAKAFSTGEYAQMHKGGYIYRYPHQLGLMLYDRILMFFSSNPAFNFVVNFIFVIGINYINYKISDILFQNKTVNILTVVFSFAFLPQLFFILFAYGLIPGFFFLISAFYNALKFARTRKTLNLTVMSISAAVALVLKKNFLIGVLALIIYFVFELLKKKKVKYFAAICILVLCLQLPSQILISCFEIVSDTKLDRGTPSVLWVAMGTDIDNNHRGPGWYDGSNYNIYTACDSDRAASAAIGEKKVKDNIEKMKNDPVATLRFFKNKTVSQWCEPMYQSVWSGPLESCQQYTHTRILKSLYNGGKAENAVEYFSKFLSLMLWGLAGVFLIFYRKNNSGWEIMFMFFMGGLLFHTVWEGKSQYIYPYAFSLIPFSMYAMYNVINAADSRMSRLLSKNI